MGKLGFSISFFISACIFFFGLTPFFAEELDLAQLQKQEAERRKNIALSKLAVTDANINSIPDGAKKYGFSQMVFAPAEAQAGYAASGQQNNDFFKNYGRERIDRLARERELERKIEEAQENIDCLEKRWRSLDQEMRYMPNEKYLEYLEERKAEVQRRIEGERLFIHFTKKRLE
jgi:predicted RNase H-like nuclease (RuvC/YqgF family)